MIFKRKSRTRIGMRTIKTALAVTISITIAYIFKLESPFFVAIAALITLQGNIVDSFRTGRDRILGTAIGAIVGFIFSHLALGNPIVIGLGIIGLIHVTNVINFKRTISISSVVFVSIMLDFSGNSILFFTIHRFIDTFVGIAVAVLVNLAIKPPFSRDIVTMACRDILNDCNEAIKKLVQKEDISLEQIEEEIAIIEREYPSYKREEESHLVKEGKINIHEVRVLINKLFHNTYLLVEMGKEHNINKNNAAIISRLYGIELEPSDDLNSEEHVYNYLLKKALDKIIELSIAIN